MDNRGQEFEDLIAAVALGTAEPGESAEVERLAAEDPEVARRLREARSAVDVMAHAVPQVDPPPRLKTDLMREVRSEAGPSRLAARTRTRPGRWASRRWPAVAAAFAALAAAMVVWNVSLRSDGSAGQTAYPLVGTDQAPAARGEVMFVGERGVAIVTLRDLPAVEPDRGYEVWLVRGKTPISAGFMQLRPDGSLVAVAEGVHVADMIAVTVEPRTNTSGPTSSPVVSAQL